MEVIDVSNNVNIKEENEVINKNNEDDKISNMRNMILKKEFLIKISLYQHDIEGFFNPPPFYLKISRFSYLWSLLPQIKEFFDYYAQNTTKHENWFEVDDIPLNWDYPFGLIFDLLINKEGKNEKYSHIIFHYRNYPSKVLGPLPSILKLKESIIHCLKDASWSRSGKSDCVKNSLNGRDVEFIWNNIKDQKILEVFNITSKLKTLFKKEIIPCRFFIKKVNQMICKNIDSKLSVLQVLKNIFPNAFKENGEFKDKYKNFKITNGGISIPLSMKMSEIDTIFHYIDFYNYFFINY